MIGLSILLTTTVASSLLTGFNLVMWNEYVSKWVRTLSVTVNVILILVASVFWVATADALSRVDYICKTYGNRV